MKNDLKTYLGSISVVFLFSLLASLSGAQEDGDIDALTLQDVAKSVMYLGLDSDEPVNQTGKEMRAHLESMGQDKLFKALITLYEHPEQTGEKIVPINASGLRLAVQTAMEHLGVPKPTILSLVRDRLKTLGSELLTQGDNMNVLNGEYQRVVRELVFNGNSTDIAKVRQLASELNRLGTMNGRGNSEIMLADLNLALRDKALFDAEKKSKAAKAARDAASSPGGSAGPNTGQANANAPISETIVNTVNETGWVAWLFIGFASAFLGIWWWLRKGRD